ncbi:MAG: NPCBM/NEW2 domain-containing protein [Pirellulales bacterium]|nr:NPCBM/NEW2 domain-containing protein [Pirellulales bacterium]
MRFPAASLLLLLATLAAPFAATQAAEGTLVTAASRAPATLRRIEAGGTYVFDVTGQSRTLTGSEFIAWGTPIESGRGVQVVLDRGGVLVAGAVSLADETLEVEDSLLWSDMRRTATIRIPLSHVAGVMFQPCFDAIERDRRLHALAATEADAERLFLANGDELKGTIVQLSPDRIEFESNVGQLDVELEKVTAVAFDPALRLSSDGPATGVLVGLADGTRLQVASLTSDETTATLQLDDETSWHVEKQEIVWLLPSHENVAWLSDLEPASYRHLPFLELEWPYQLDRSVTGGLLRSGGRLYLKGVGMHSTARLSWDLAQPWRRFEADLALDDSAGKRGSVVFRVFADGKEAFASPVIRGGEPPRPISVDITGAERLSLIVDFADRGDELDHADWLHARLVR